MSIVWHGGKALDWVFDCFSEEEKKIISIETARADALKKAEAKAEPAMRTIARLP